MFGEIKLSATNMKYTDVFHEKQKLSLKGKAHS